MIATLPPPPPPNEKLPTVFQPSLFLAFPACARHVDRKLGLH